MELFTGVLVICTLFIMSAIAKKSPQDVLATEYAKLFKEIGSLRKSLEHLEEQMDDMQNKINRVHALLPQRWANRYELVFILGEGGVGRVWHARDLLIERDVALKILKPEFAEDRNNRRRFMREARTAAQLSNDYVVEIYDFGTFEDQLYMVMQRLEGTTLRDQINLLGGAAPESVVYNVAENVLVALIDAHSKSLVHRDLKPENICVEQGRYIVVDFGLAFMTSTSSEMARQTEEGVAGTPWYMPPEQFQADRDLSSAADIYALGCVIYELLSGNPPFDAKTWNEMSRQHLEIHPNYRILPEEWRPLIQKMLQKDPENRPTAKQALDDLRTICLSTDTKEM